MAYSKVTNYSYNKVNPFSESAIDHISIRRKNKTVAIAKGRALVNTETGENEGFLAVRQSLKVDEAQFTKIYLSTLGNWVGLTRAGLRVFTYIATILKKNKDSFYIDYDECMEFTKYKSKKTILSGIGELLESGFIARGKNTFHFYINPTMFFNGDRLILMQDYQKISSSSEKAIE